MTTLLNADTLDKLIPYTYLNKCQMYNGNI